MHRHLDQEILPLPQTQFLTFVVAILDISVIFSYMSGISPPLWYIGVLSIKIVMAVSHAKHIAITQRSAIFIAAVLVGVIPGTLISGYAGDGILRVFGFCVQLLLTTALIGRNGLALYLRVAAVAISALSAAHIIFYLVDIIPSHYGRALYFGGNHPNLGAEIGAIGVLAATLSTSWRSAVIISTPIIYSVALMQGRAALLSIAMILLIHIVHSVLTRSSRTPLSILTILIAALLLVILFTLSAPFLFSSVGDVFMLNDQYRGLGSGFVGRNERWNAGMLAFETQPFFGVGANYFERQVSFTPHNYFIFGLATMGLLGFSVFLLVIAILYIQIMRKNVLFALTIVGILPLLVFNDRLLNMNPYPFLLYVILVSFPIGGHLDPLNTVSRRSTSAV